LPTVYFFIQLDIPMLEVIQMLTMNNSIHQIEMIALAQLVPVNHCRQRINIIT
jgi:hypothetical protein